MNTRFPARTALVTALAFCFAAPAIAADQAPIHLAQASSGGGGSNTSSGSTGNASGASGTSATGSNASAGSNDKASSSPATTGRPDSQRSVTTTGTTTRQGSTSGTAMNNGARSASPSANPGNAGFRNWWNEQAQQHDGRVTRDQYNQEMERRWRELDRDNRGLTPAELDRLHGWNSNVQPGASETHNLGKHPNSDNAQAK